MKKKKKYVRPVNIGLSEGMFIKLKIITDEEEINISEFIRSSIKEKIEKTINQKKEI